MDLNKIGQWRMIQAKLAALKEEELLLRNEVFNEVFPNPKEGTSTVNLPEGWKLKGVYKINRTLDETVLADYLAKLPVDIATRIVVRKPTLVIGEYNKLSVEQKNLFDHALTAKPGTPSMELVAPKVG